MSHLRLLRPPEAESPRDPLSAVIGLREVIVVLAVTTVGMLVATHTSALLRFAEWLAGG